MKRPDREIHLERRLAALESELSLCREILAASADAVLLVDSDLVVIRANRAAGESMGRIAGELTGRTCYELCGESEACAGCPCRQAKGARTGKTTVAAGLRSGRRQCRAVSGAPDDGIVGAITISRSEEVGVTVPAGERVDLSAESMPVACHSLDGDARLVAVNQAWLDLLGYRRQEVMGKPFGRFVCPDRLVHFERTFAFLLQRGEISGVEMEICRKDGQAVPVLVDGRGSFDEQGALQRATCILTPPRPAEWSVGATVGMLPICSSCKKIRDKGGLWHNIEYYLHIHARIEFSHGICPDCLSKLYPELYQG